MRSVLLEGEAEQAKQRAPLVVGVRRRDHRDVHATEAIDPVLVDLVEHDLLSETERVVAVAVELARRQAAEVANTRQGECEQPVEELPHPVVSQGDVATDRHVLAQLELGDRLLRPGDLRLLTGDRGQVADRSVDQLRVASSLADTHVHDDLGQAGDLHDVGVTELLAQLGRDLVAVALLETRRGTRARRSCTSAWRLSRGRCHAVATIISLPHFLQMRTGIVLPVSSFSTWRRSMRVARSHSGHTTMTLLTCTGASCVTMPPVFAPRVVVVILVCLRMRLTPSTRTRSRPGSVSMTLPLKPRSLPEITWTVSPFRTFRPAMTYSTSGASEMIRMNFFSRSSRPTGPKMRVPRGSPPSLIRTAAFSSNLMYEPSGRRRSFTVRTTTAFTTSPFFTPAPGNASLTVATMTSPTPRVPRRSCAYACSLAREVL